MKCFAATVTLITVRRPVRRRLLFTAVRVFHEEDDTVGWVRRGAIYRGMLQSCKHRFSTCDLSFYFLGNRIDNRLTLTPIAEDSRLPFRAGAAVPAEDVLKSIVPLAQSYNGLPQ